ncbi:MAG: hypothetical protein IJL37_00895 [Bacteroidaceae bacterium]|nr:hypothetical protein [Bacteroidaceae bacterium]
MGEGECRHLHLTFTLLHHRVLREQKLMLLEEGIKSITQGCLKVKVGEGKVKVEPFTFTNLTC